MVKKLLLAAAVLIGGGLVFGATLLVMSIVAPHHSAPVADTGTYTTPATTAPATPDTPSEQPKLVTSSPKASHIASRRSHQATSTPTESPKPRRSAMPSPSASSTMPNAFSKFAGAWHSDDAGTTIVVGPTAEYPHLNPNQGVLLWDDCTTCVVNLSFKVVGNTLVGTVTNHPKLPPSIVDIHKGSQIILTPHGDSQLDVQAPGMGDEVTYYHV